MIAGIARIGIASTAASVRMFAAVRPPTIRGCRSPDSTSIRYCSAAPTAPPPGATFEIALPASCEVTIGDQTRTCSVSRCSAVMQARVAACRTSIPASQAGLIFVRSSADPTAAMTLGATRYSGSP